MERLIATVVGGGVVGLWQALVLARRGHSVALCEAAAETESGAASRMAGAMLAPYCESEAAEPIVLELGLRGLQLWQQFDPSLETRGTLVVASRRDEGELGRFARETSAHVSVDNSGIGALEPALCGRFSRGLYFANEAHMAPRVAISRLIGELRRLNVALRFSCPVPQPLWMAAAAGELVIDCRGISARANLPHLRGVRGEMAVVLAPELRLTRPVRLLHPRFPMYVVPWGDGTYMIGASVIENETAMPVTVRSALDLLGSAYAIHPGFAEARIVELSAGIRPAFPDNLPKIGMHGRCLSVNGAYRHGFLLAPVLAEIVADYLEAKAPIPARLDASIDLGQRIDDTADIALARLHALDRRQ